ncbi:MAG: tetratricopeptide repeat protein [Methanothrix sp.]|nr:tetratricopeptide repeat protein [Methanothrix sp.]MCX8207507.1 tetratricopeptide repeat protein [Methanothrix sp.]
MQVGMYCIWQLIAILTLISCVHASEENETITYLLNLSHEGLARSNYDGSWQAVKYADKALEINDSDWKAWWYKTEAYRQITRFEDMKLSADRLIDIAPNSTIQAVGYYYRAVANSFLGEASDAASDFSRALDLFDTVNRTASEVLRALRFKCLVYSGWNEWRRGDFDAAIRLADQAVELHAMIEPPAEVLEAHFLKISALVSQEKYDDAIRLGESVVFLNGSDGLKSWVYFKTGVAYGGLGRNSDARECFKKAIELDDDEYEFWVMLSVSYAAENEYWLALAAIDRAIALNEYDGNAWLVKGRILEGIGQEYQAYECYKKAGELGFKPV